MRQNTRLTTTYYRTFLLYIVFPLLIIIITVLGLIRRNTLAAAISRIELTQHNIAASLKQDIDYALMQFSHFLLTNDNRSLEQAK